MHHSQSLVGFHRTKAMASFRKKGPNWYYRYTDADGRRVEKKGCPDRRVTEDLARAAESEVARIRAGLSDPRAEALRRHLARPLNEHLNDWCRAMLDRGRTSKHADLSLTRVRTLAEVAGIVRLSDLETSRIQVGLATMRIEGRSLQTLNHYRACLRAFVRWARADGRLDHDPMAGVSGYNAQEDVRHARRTLTHDELARLINAARRGPVVLGMDGEARAMAYQVAAWCGLRVRELRSLTPESFRLDGDNPVIVVRPPSEKARHGAEQPAPQPLVAELREWLRDKPPKLPVFPLHRETARMMRRDLLIAAQRS